jgi:predicted nucleotidyltransferase
MADILELYVNEIKNAFGDNLRSVVLYGSKAGGEDTGKHSDYNLLVIVENIILERMALLTPSTKKWVKSGNRPPMIFTAAEFVNSSDVFPVEFLDMKDRHKLLYGRDYLSEIKVDDANLRHECEFDLKSKLLTLRQSFIMLRDRPKEIKALLIGSVSSFLVIFRHVAKLLGAEMPANKIDSLNILSQKAGIKQDVFKNVHDMKRGDKSALNLAPEKLMEEYLREIENIIKVMDKL